MTERLSPREKNGFAIVEVTPRRITIRLFARDRSDPAAALERLEPDDEVTMTVPEARRRGRRFRERWLPESSVVKVGTESPPGVPTPR